MPLHIPEDEIPAIVKIRSLSDDSAKELAKALESAEPAPTSEEMAKHIAKQVPSIPVEDLPRIVDTIYDLYFIREFAEVDLPRFLDDLIEGMRDSRVPELVLKTGDVKHIRDRFKKLLSVQALATLSKARRLQRDGERLYCEAKILSDLRPVFSDDVRSQPTGGVITHTLRISFHEAGSGDLKQFFVVLDTQDLEELRTLVDRANTKGNTLRGLMKRAKLIDLGE